ncbi:MULTISPECIES: hypothetical protein [unclassified Bradyrhizobium]|nr:MULTISPECIES: hypothetical protein [unclassified Bradyrhizobium]
MSSARKRDRLLIRRDKWQPASRSRSTDDPIHDQFYTTVKRITDQRSEMEDANSSTLRRPGGLSRTRPPGHLTTRSCNMDFLNHLVAARLMKTAEGFERIGAHGASRRLPAPTRARATSTPALGLVVDNSAGSEPVPALACPDDQGCSAGL